MSSVLLTAITEFFVVLFRHRAMGDFHELKLEFKSVWSPVTAAVGAGAPGVGSSSARLTARSTDFAPYSPAQQSTGSAKSTPTRLSSQSSYQRTSFSADSSAFSPAGVSASRLSRAGADNIIAADVSPGARFCHVGVLYGSSFYIFGGYDGTNRLNDFLRYDFAKNAQQPFIKTAPSTLVRTDHFHPRMFCVAILIFLPFIPSVD